MAKDISKMSYEEARDELQEVVAQLEQQNVTLDASMALWERGEALAKVCEEWLSGARKKLTDAQGKKDSK
ncbi:MAG: exodeoxyribonuclease VII small subunit [Aquiluna sp.]|jgi:exodeoxyribonuclease VII small subunit